MVAEGYEVIQNGKTQFYVDWSVMRRLVRSYWMANLAAQAWLYITVEITLGFFGSRSQFNSVHDPTARHITGFVWSGNTQEVS
jgi:hypothetical protein